jgi:hypothetical protein
MGRVGCVTLPMPVPSPDKSGGSTKISHEISFCVVDMYYVKWHFLLPKETVFL